MAAVTPLNDLDLEDLLSRYGLGAVESYWPATNGIENSNYFVRLAGPHGTRDVVLTMLEQPAHAPSILVPLLDVCDDAGNCLPEYEPDTTECRPVAGRRGWNLRNFADLQLCFTGSSSPVAPGCGPYDFDSDFDVDWTDFGAFTVTLSGPAARGPAISSKPRASNSSAPCKR